MRTTHAALTHFISERESMSQVVGVKRRIRRRRVLVLGRMSRERSLGRAEGILVRDAVLGADMLQNLLVNVEVRRGVRETMLVANPAVREIGLSFGGVGAAIAAVRGAVQALVVGAGAVAALALAFVRTMAIIGAHRGIGHDEVVYLVDQC